MRARWLPSGRVQNHEIAKVPSVKTTIPGDQPVVLAQSVSADQEIGDNTNVERQIESWLRAAGIFVDT